jgi:hypothetical protein
MSTVVCTEEVAKTHRLEGEFKDLSIKYSQKEVELDEVTTHAGEGLVLLGLFYFY